MEVADVYEHGAGDLCYIFKTVSGTARFVCMRAYCFVCASSCQDVLTVRVEGQAIDLCIVGFVQLYYSCNAIRK